MDSIMNLASAGAQGMRLHAREEHWLSDRVVGSASRPVQISALALSIFSIVGGILTIGHILCNRRPASSKQKARRRRLKWLPQLRLHEADVAPLVVAVAVVFQSTILLALNSVAMSATTQTNCLHLARTAWIAMWSLPYTMLVFGFEAVLRGFQQTSVFTRFAGTVRVCVMTVALMLFITWLPLGSVKPFTQCLPTLTWWSSSFNALATPILCTVLALAMLSSATIVVQLTRWRKQSRIERLVALQMLSYMFLLVMLPSLCLPFFILFAQRRANSAVAILPTMAFNALGLIVSILYGIFRYAQRGQRTSDLVPTRPSAWYGTSKTVINEKEPLPRRKRSSTMTTATTDRPLPPLPISPPPTSRPPRSSSIYSSSPSNSNSEEGSPSPYASSATLHGAMTPRIASISSLNSTDRANIDDLERQYESLRNEVNLLQPPTRPFARDLSPGLEPRSASIVTSATVEVGLSLSDLMSSSPGRAPRRRSAEVLPLSYSVPGTPRMI